MAAAGRCATQPVYSVAVRMYTKHCTTMKGVAEREVGLWDWTNCFFAWCLGKAFLRSLLEFEGIFPDRCFSPFEDSDTNNSNTWKFLFVYPMQGRNWTEIPIPQQQWETAHPGMQWVKVSCTLLQESAGCYRESHLATTRIGIQSAAT